MRDEAVECPRCGYDLSGLAASWTNSCPVDGVCSECGLEFSWPAVLVLRLRATPGFFEHAMRRQVSSFVLTLWCNLRPGRFWRWVRLEGPLAQDRAMVFGVLAPLVAGLFAALALAGACLLALIVQGILRTSYPIEFGDLFAHAAWPSLWFDDDARAPALLGGVAGVLVAPTLLLVLGESLRLASVRRVHLIRIIAYSTVSAALVYAGSGLVSILHDLTWRWRWAEDDSFVGELAGLVGEVLEVPGPAIGPVLAIAWLVWATHCACRRYLRLDHSGVIAAAVGVAGALVGGIVASVVAIVMMRT